MIKISKEDFVSAIDAIEKYFKEIDEFSASMERYSGAGYYCTIGENLMNNYMTLLENLVNDVEDETGEFTLEWWFFEDVEKIIYVDEQEIDVSTPELLYNYFVLMDNREENK